MKKLLLICLTLLLINCFAQDVNITFPNYYSFSGGYYNPTDYDKVVYLDPGETIDINSGFGSDFLFDIYKANYVTGVTPTQIYTNQATYNFNLYQNVLPCFYTFQSGFTDFVFFVIYDNYFQLKEIYKLLVINNEVFTASLDENERSDFKLFPNPVQSELKINAAFTNDNYQIMDLNGRELINTRNENIDVSQLQAGQYLLKIGSSVQRFVKE